MRARAFRVVILVMLCASIGLAQQQQPQTQTPQATFRATTRLIVQSVFVKDKDGKPIEGLTAKDFVITEDGQPQDIAFVEYQRLATEIPAPAADPQAPTPLTAKPATTATTVAPAVQTGISSPPPWPQAWVSSPAPSRTSSRRRRLRISRSSARARA